MQVLWLSTWFLAPLLSVNIQALLSNNTNRGWFVAEPGVVEV